MRWKALPASRAVPPAKTSVKEIEGLRQLVSRDLADAGLTALSADRRFATAYNAVLRLSKMAIACAGYRVTSGAGHHRDRNGRGAEKSCQVAHRRDDERLPSSQKVGRLEGPSNNSAENLHACSGRSSRSTNAITSA
jgi:hypothetical protein